MKYPGDTLHNMVFGFLRKPLPAIIAAIRNFATFRFGQNIGYADITEDTRRIALLNLLGYILPKKAFKDGFEIRNKKGEEKDKRVDDLSDAIDELEWLPELTRIAQIETNYGACTAVIFRDNGSELKGFAPDSVELELNEDENSEDIGEIIGVKVTEKIGGVKVTEVKRPITGEDMDNVQHIVLRPSEIRYRGIPKIEAPWDIAHAHNVTLESAMVNNVRRGYGIKKATIVDRDDPSKNALAVSRMEEGLQDLESGDTSIVLFTGVDSAGNVWKEEVDIDSGKGDYNYTEKLDMYHKVFSSLTGIPKNYLDGIYAGETLAGDTIERQLNSSFDDIRREYTPVFEKILKRWCKINKKDWKDGYYLHWILENYLTEREEAEIEDIKANTDATLKTSGIESAEEIRKRRGLIGDAPEPDSVELLIKDEESDDKADKGGKPDE